MGRRSSFKEATLLSFGLATVVMTASWGIAVIAARAAQSSSSGVQTSPVSADAGKPVTAPAGVYHNGALGFSYTYPKGWTVATGETLRAANAALPAAAPAKQPGMQRATPEFIFYACASQVDPTLRAVPSVRITSVEAVGAMLTPEVMKSDAANREKTGLKAIRAPEKFSIGDQDLYRMDFEDGRAGHSWVSVIETVVYDHVLVLEILATSQAQLDQLVATVKNSAFADADKK